MDVRNFFGNKATQTTSKMSQEDIIAKEKGFVVFIDYKTLEPKIAAVEIAQFMNGKILGRLDIETETYEAPTTLSHHKFSVDLRSQFKEIECMVATTVLYLQYIIGMPRKLFEGQISVEKAGLFIFGNEYETQIRVWNTKKFGKRVVFEVSVATYKPYE